MKDAAGFYLSSYVRSSDQARRYLLASQMAGSARQALPCFDESTLKPTFAITADHEAQHQAWSNMQIENQAKLLNGLIRTQFGTSLPMSSSLSALVVADFACVTRNDTGRYENITTRVCAQPEKKDYLPYALEVAAENIRNFEIQYQINYPLAKCDHIAVREFDAGREIRGTCVHGTLMFLVQLPWRISAASSIVKRKFSTTTVRRHC